jgi:hypothetical protein
MPDFGAPVADQIQTNPNQYLQTLGGLLGVQQQRQGLQLGQQQLQVGQSDVQQAQQQMSERELLQQAMASGKTPQGDPLRDANGEVDPVALAKFANTDLPLTGQHVMQSIIQTQHSRIQLNDAVRGLGQNYRNDVSGIVRSAIGTQENPQQITAALDAYAKQNPDAQPAITRAQALVANLNPNMPQAARDQALQHLAMEFQPAATTAGEQGFQNQPYTAPGGRLGFVQTNQLAPGGPTVYGPTPQQGFAPGLGVTHDAAGNLVAYNTEAPGAAILLGHGGQLPGLGGGEPLSPTMPTAPSATPNASDVIPPKEQAARDAEAAQLMQQELQKQQQNLASAKTPQEVQAAQSNIQALQTQLQKFNIAPSGQQGGAYEPPTMTLGQPDIIHQNTQTVNQTRLAAASAQTELNVLDHIVSLAQTPNLYLGPGSSDIGKLATAVAQIPGMSGAQKYSTNYNELAKFMAQNAVRMGKQLGLSGSDSRIDLAMHQNPNAQIGPQAIIGIAQYQQALVRMGVAKADAMDSWLSQPGNSLANEQKFEQLWRDNADPRLFEMHGQPNQADAAKYAQSHITKGEAQGLSKKYQVLKSLGAF